MTAPTRRIAALLVAGGRGERFGAPSPKQFLTLGGRPLVEHAARVFDAEASLDAVWVVATPGWEARTQELLAQAGLDKKLRGVVTGGATRQESVERGLAAIDAYTHVVVHDAARPFVTSRLVRAATAAAVAHGAATVALPVGDTLMRAAAASETQEPRASAASETHDPRAPALAFAAATLHRDGAWTVQTPQAFELELLREAHLHARQRDLAATDDGGLVLALGHPVALVHGNWWNLKATRPEDLRRAEWLWTMRASLHEEEGA